MNGSFSHHNRAVVDVVLRYKIRNAIQPDNPALISQWLALDSCPSYYHLHEQQKHYEQQFRFLLDTIADELLPGHWRRACLEQIHKPMKALSQITYRKPDIQHLGKLYEELRVTCDYVSGSLNRSDR